MIATSTDILEGEPTELTSGDLFTWRRTLDNSFSAALGYSLTYKIAGLDGGDITATGSANVFTVSVLPAVTSAWIEGTYPLLGWVAKTGKRYPVYDGKLIIHEDPAQIATGEDRRSHAKICLDVVESVIEMRATRPEAEYEYQGIGRRYRFKTDDELIKLRQFYQAEYRRELNQDDIRAGKNVSKLIRERFISAW